MGKHSRSMCEQATAISLNHQGRIASLDKRPRLISPRTFMRIMVPVER